MPAISVIVPFYNRLEWTRQAINSVLCQTMQDFEILLIDDGSSDDISQFSDLLNNKKLVYSRQENRGMSTARNKGLKLATGEFIAFLDSDDLFYPNKLELQLNTMHRNPSILWSHTSYDRIDENGKFLETMHSGGFKGKVYPLIYTYCPIAIPTVMIRRRLFTDNELRFDEDIIVSEDILLWSQLAKRSDVLGIDVPLTKVRIHGTNAAFDNQKRITGRKNIIAKGIQRDSFLTTDDRKKILASNYAVLSDLYFEESDTENSNLYSQMAKKESFLIWVKFLVGQKLRPFKRKCVLAFKKVAKMVEDILGKK